MPYTTRKVAGANKYKLVLHGKVINKGATKQTIRKQIQAIEIHKHK
jgi:hypothetical protein